MLLVASVLVAGIAWQQSSAGDPLSAVLSSLSPKGAADMRQQALDKIKRLDEEADGLHALPLSLVAHLLEITFEASNLNDESDSPEDAAIENLPASSLEHYARAALRLLADEAAGSAGKETALHALTTLAGRRPADGCPAIEAAGGEEALHAALDALRAAAGAGGEREAYLAGICEDLIEDLEDGCAGVDGDEESEAPEFAEE